jgi:hypothetical protein
MENLTGVDRSEFLSRLLASESGTRGCKAVPAPQLSKELSSLHPLFSVFFGRVEVRISLRPTSISLTVAPSDRLTSSV